MNYLEKIVELSKNGNNFESKEILDLVDVNRGVLMKTVLFIGTFILTSLYTYLTGDFQYSNGVYNFHVSGVIVLALITFVLSIVYSIQLYKYKKKLKSYGITKILN